MSGATLLQNELGRYPFANQAVAANAIIAQPLRFSFMMECPSQGGGGYVSKLLTFTALQSILAQHAAAGGTYTCATPAFIWTNAILMSLRLLDGQGEKQVQTACQWDFEQPLISLAAANQAQNAQMSKLTAGGQTTGDNSGLAATVGAGGTSTTPTANVISDFGGGPATNTALA